MRKRDRARQWFVEADVPPVEISPIWGQIHKCHYLTGDNRTRGHRLKEVGIGEWFKAKLIQGRTKNSREIYLVQFGNQSYVVKLNDNGQTSIRLQWADSFVEAKPENIGQLTNSTANAKRKRS